MLRAVAELMQMRRRVVRRSCLRAVAICSSSKRCLRSFPIGKDLGSLKLKYNDEKEGLSFTLNADLTQECVLCQRCSDALNAPAL
jgi:hypothetical protein